MLTLGSLFDGIGGFPLAGIHNGITPLWASEIEAFPIRVTKRRFPEMLHVGDITKLDGGKLPPVDVICGGSPCQDLSVAGKRQGLSGERSGLFMDQIRIVKEMRKADEIRGTPAHLVRPRFLVWENVPGAFSSTEGEDFRAVLEEIVRVKAGSCHVPRPDARRWGSAGAAILGDEFSLAWRVLDAQYWGVAQRRRRIFLVADFGGSAAPAVLFKQDSLCGNLKEGEGEGEGTAGNASGSAKDTGWNGGITAEGERPEFYCINDQGGDRMDVTAEQTGTLRAGMGSHQPLVLANQQGGAEIGAGICPTVTSAAGTSGNNQPVLFENHGIDARYTGPHRVAPTMSARYGTGGNNVPLVTREPESYYIAGNIIDREVKNGGNGLGCQPDISYTLTGMDRHAVFSRQRVDELIENDVASTQSARQYKDATDLVCEFDQEIVGTIGASDHKGINNQYVSEDKCIVENRKLIRRLTPLECERLQGFPDGWTDIEGASDSARYKALGNSVAIPCVDFVLRGIAYFLRQIKGENV